MRYLTIILLLASDLDLKDKLYGRFQPTKDVGADRVSYATSNGMRVPAIVYHQAGATIRKHPAILVLNKPGEDKSSRDTYSAGIVYARAGAVVLTYDPPGEFERNRHKRSGEEMAKMRQSSDIEQGVRYLAQRIDVDPKAIASEQSGELLTKAAALRLNEKLKFPNWTKKQIHAMPDRLGSDVPEVPRADLQAIPDVLWEAEQDSYVTGPPAQP